ncbi:ectoine/hydroxyectoine ABC transporter substrate-binding protein EhuB [Pikeienuella sp. HZG-20]|uniref:ectoine/hydroxyectoine ABC transporter substrate-binding protein EhuB n=1 Tax=Paludibacillus litoralis TaxID=3133267 RepID=UPI0030EC0295
MFNISVRLVAAAGAVALSAAAAQAASLQDIKDRGFVRVAVANEIPYGYVDPSGEAKGAGPDVARAVLERLGIESDDIQWIVTNFSSLIPGLQANRFDMVAAELAIRPERCTKVIYSEPNTSYGEGLLVAEGNPKDLHAFTDFKEGDSKVAVMAGADQLQMLQHLGVSEDNIVTIATNADAISTVSTGRADAYAATSLTASGLAGKSDKVAVVDTFKDPVIDGKPVRSWGGFAFNQDSADLRDAVSEALVEFKKTSAWSEILKEYGFTTADIEHSSEVTTQQLCAGG